MTSLQGCRVAVIGARGIGKHHAKWWAIEGADVVAFAGTSPESVEETAGSLRDLFAFRGKGYTNIEKMLETESPAVVDVCSPDPCHYAHARAALEAGAHVLCEKPFVFDDTLDRDAMLAQARELVAMAGASGLLLGICTQYVMGMRAFLELWRNRRGNESIERFQGELASPHQGKRPTLRDIWIDLGPHPLSMLQTLAPGGTIDWPSVHMETGDRSCTASFDAVTVEGRALACEITVGKTVGSPTHIRRAVLNDCSFEVEAENGSDGQYCSRIVTPHGSHEHPDLMRLIIRAFLTGAPAANGVVAVRNLEWLLRFLDWFPPRSRGTAL